MMMEDGEESPILSPEVSDAEPAEEDPVAEQSSKHPGRAGNGSDDEEVDNGEGRGGEANEEEEEEEAQVELGKQQQSLDPEKIQAVLSKFTPDQMNRYECYRRANFQKSNMKKLLQSVTGSQVSVPMTIVMAGIAKMFVGEVIEKARIIMTEQKERGPVRPCHIRQAYRRLKLEGKIPLRTRPRLFS